MYKVLPGTSVTYIPMRDISITTADGICAWDAVRNLLSTTYPTVDPIIQGFTSESEITYGLGKGKMNPCYHIKEVAQDFSSDSTFLMCHGAWNPAYKYTYAFSGMCRPPVQPRSYSLLPITSEMRKRAWQALLPSINDGFSLFNFLIEIPEALMLIGLTKGLKKFLQNVAKHLAKGHPDKALAELALLYSFGIAPLMSDIPKIWDLLHNVDKRIADFVQRGKKVNPWHYTEEFPGTSSEMQSAIGGIILSTKSVYHATAWLSYEYLATRAQALLEVWGVMPTPSRVWNAVPFSFVLDWVYDVSTFLEQLEISRVRVKLSGYCDSMKTESISQYVRKRELAYYLSGTNISLIDWKEGQVLHDWRKVAYNRVPGVPETGMALPASDELSARELVLAGALLRALT